MPPRSARSLLPSLTLTPLAVAAGLLAGAGAVCAEPAEPSVLQQSPALQPLPRGEAARQLLVVMQAERLQGRPDQEAVAEGKVDFRRAGMVIRADRLSYDSAQDLARATGQVRISQGGVIYSGPEMQLRVQRFEGFFLHPSFEFTQLGAGGKAERIDFLDSARARATRAEYTSCPRDGPEEPAWVLRTDSVRLDLDRNEGIAEGAVLRFLGTPILALPALSFPLSDARKSGWLPPSVSTDNRSGIELSIPYYWNIAPNRDATLTPRIITRRGLGLDTEFRYLEPAFDGSLELDWLPHDRVTRQARDSVQWLHDGRLGTLRYGADIVRVSDNAWWKDFPGSTRGFTSRLLAARAFLEQPFNLQGADGLFFARALRWQALQDSDAVVVAPYERSPQVGLRLGGRSLGLQYDAETEYNRFTLPSGDAGRAGRAAGERVHMLGRVARPWREPGWWIVPRLAVNAASYSRTTELRDAGTALGRVIPTLSVDAGLEFERQTVAFGRAVQQTLEPRFLYVRTPFRAQSQFPNYDAAARDFNFDSIYSDNQFSGVDRVNDADQLTAGFTTRFVDSASGAEALRLGLVQRVLFRSQRVTAQADGTPDGPPLDQRLSDLLLLGSTSVFKGWNLDAALQYSTDLQRSVRSIVGARYSPGPYRTVSATYRLTRGLSEQVELGWQWPVYGSAAGTAAARQSGSSCSGTWYTVGRMNYSVKDSRVTDSVLGLEYDAGCWIGRFVAERLSTGRSEATSRLMLQLELVGLSRIGSNPLKVLKDNIPGYRLLREERRGASSSDDRSSAPSYD